MNISPLCAYLLRILLIPSTIDMEGKIIQRLLQSLQEVAIPCCLVGELALNYYNVPRVVHVRFPSPFSLRLEMSNAFTSGS